MAEKEHFIIGLTGNIGSGKSMVLNMLRHMGAYGIDADDLARRAHQLTDVQVMIRQQFGTTDRKKLAEIVFHDPQALAGLEAIVHPAVTRMAKTLINIADAPITVVEAIKLLESDLVGMCDNIWVVDADADAVAERLMRERGMNKEEISARLANQSAVSEKEKLADSVIHNSGTREQTWQKTRMAWDSFFEGPAQEKFKQSAQRQFPPLVSQIITPFSEPHSKLRTLIDASPDLHWIPEEKRITRDHLDRMVCDGFMFNPVDMNQGTQYYAGRMTTFKFFITNILCLNQGEEHGKNGATLAASIGEAYHCEAVQIPIPQTFNPKIEEALQEAGFFAVQEESMHTTQWHKAGYNVFNKQIWDFDAYLKGKLNH